MSRLTIPRVNTILNTDARTLLQAIPEQVDLIFTSPPYNIGPANSERRDGYRKKGKYDPKSYGGIRGYFDCLPEDEYQDDQVKLLETAATSLKTDGTLVYNHKPRRRNLQMIHPMVWLSRVQGLTLMEEIIWDRGSTHNHSNRLLWPHTERLYVFRRTDGTYRFRNHAKLAHRHDIWHIPLTPTPYGGHAAPYPERLARAVVQAFSRAGDLVVDPYMGSGTTAAAAVALGRNFLGAEKDPHYADLALKRVEEVSRAA